MRILACKNNKIIAKPFIYSCCITQQTERLVLLF